jgi:hypothetical protein
VTDEAPAPALVQVFAAAGVEVAVAAVGRAMPGAAASGEDTR